MVKGGKRLTYIVYNLDLFLYIKSKEEISISDLQKRFSGLLSLEDDLSNLIRLNAIKREGDRVYYLSEPMRQKI